MRRKSIIISISGYTLKKKEKELIKKEKPWGLILFKRNIRSFNQIQKLIKDIKKITRDKKFPILIDEEGFKVSRLSNIISHNLDANFFGNLYENDKDIAISLYTTYLRFLNNILKKIGINFNTIPVLDVKRKKTHSIIGSRSFSKKKRNS